MTERAWVPFTAAADPRPGTRMRGWHGNPKDAWAVQETRNEVVVFTNGRWIGVVQAKPEGWEVEV